MYKTHPNSIALKSQFLISNTLVELMKTRNYKSISISELCLASGVSRKTFYRNFEVIDDVLDFFLDHFAGELQHGSFDSPTVEDQLRFFFSFCKENHAVLEIMYRNGLLFMLESKFSILIRKILAESNIPLSDDEHMTQFIIGGLTFLVFHWAESSFAEDTESISKKALMILRRIYQFES